MPTAALSALTVFAGSFSLWYRRHTFTAQIERQLTWAIALMLAGFYLVSPASTGAVGTALHRVTGIWHLDTSIGTMFYIAALAIVVDFVLAHFFTPEQRTDWLSAWVLPPAAVGATILAIAIVRTGATTAAPQILDIEPDAWLLTHRIVAAIVLGWLWLTIVRCLMVMRTDPNSRRMANACIAVAATGAVAAAATGVGNYTAITVLHTAALVGFAGCAVSAWRDKLNQFAKLRRAVRCHGGCAVCRRRG